MAIAFLGKVILGSVVGLATVTPITYFSVKGVSSSNAKETFLTKNNCGNFPLNATTKEKIIVCGLTWTRGSSNLTFYFYDGGQEEVNTKDFNEEKLTKINSLSWKGKTSGAENQSHLLLTLEGTSDQTKNISQDHDYLPNQDIEKLEEKCSNDESGLYCTNEEKKGVQIKISRFQDQN